MRSVSNKESKREKSAGAFKKPVKQVGQFILGKKLGEGTFGKVVVGNHVITGQKVAIKVLEKAKMKDREDKERVNREISILKKLKHRNIAQLYCVIETASTIYLIIEYSDGPDFYDFIVQYRKVSESQASDYYSQIIGAVEYIHKQRIAHRDIKPENLTLEQDNKVIKLIDFGLSNTYVKGKKLQTPCGSPCYAAPEMIEGKLYEGLLVDIWSSGIVLFAMICGYLPFEVWF